jgi:hypothetical protein
MIHDLVLYFHRQNYPFKALVYTSEGESRVSVVTANGSQLATHAFTSDGKQHGYEVDGAYRGARDCLLQLECYLCAALCFLRKDKDNE